MIVKFKKLSADAVTPAKAHPSDAGYDLTAVSREFNEDKTIVTYHTGIATQLPEKSFGLILSRSSIRNYDLQQTNSVGTLDLGYRGEICISFRITHRRRFPWQRKARIYEIGDRIGQLIPLTKPSVVLAEVPELSNSDRGTGGFGSTGR